MSTRRSRLLQHSSQVIAEVGSAWPYSQSTWMFISRKLPRIEGTDLRFERGGVRAGRSARQVAIASETSLSSRAGSSSGSTGDAVASPRTAQYPFGESPSRDASDSAMRSGVSRFAAVAVLLLVLGGCASSSRLQDLDSRRGNCALDQRLPGKWKTKVGFSQVGPARYRMDLKCDCTYVARGVLVVGLLPMFLKDEGWYSASAGVIRFDGGVNSSVSSYSIADDTLVVDEGGGEVFRYRRTRRHSCSEDAKINAEPD